MSPSLTHLTSQHCDPPHVSECCRTDFAQITTFSCTEALSCPSNGHDVGDCSSEDAVARPAARPRSGVSVFGELGFAREAGMVLGTGNVVCDPPLPSRWVPLPPPISWDREVSPRRGEHPSAMVVDASAKPKMLKFTTSVELPSNWVLYSADT